MTVTYKNYLDEKRKQHLDELFEFLSIPSISALSEHSGDTSRAAQWVASALKKIDMENVQIYPTKGHPVVYGEWLKAPGKPTVLIYGHYDVQPVDPLSLWETPPFEPQIRNGSIFARGASDDKGQVFMHLKALEAIYETTGTYPFNFKLCIEGEEEIGSPNLPAFIEKNRDLLAADVIVISDTAMIEEDQPTICYGLRGLCGIQIDLKGPDSDLHSGLYGGAVQNPIHALVQLLETFHNKDGEITVSGFYDGVIEADAAEREAFKQLNMSEEELRKELGVPSLYGEKGYTHLERTWIRPTLEINGISGGFQGEGIKTVLPSKASAKITCRLVPGQDPDDILLKLQAHIAANSPEGVEISITPFDKGAPFVTPYTHPAIQAASAACEQIFGVPAAFTRGGGSLPIVTALDSILRAPIVLLGFALPTDNVHAPNEHFALKNYDSGLLTLCAYWDELDRALSRDGDA